MEANEGSTNLRIAILSETIIINNKVYVVRRYGDIPFICGKCQKSHPGFVVLAKRQDDDLSRTFIIFQADPAPCHASIFVMWGNEPILASINLQLDVVDEKNKAEKIITYWFETQFESREEGISLLQKFLFRVKFTKIDELTGLSLAFDYNREGAHILPSGKLYGQYSISDTYPDTDQLFKEVCQVFPNLRLLSENETPTKLASLQNHEFTYFSIDDVIENSYPDKLFDFALLTVLNKNKNK